MTEELKKKLVTKHSEEKSDMSSYEALANEMHSAGCHHEAGIIEDIAHEEKTHAELIEHILEMHEK